MKCHSHAGCSYQVNVRIWDSIASIDLAFAHFATSNQIHSLPIEPLTQEWSTTPLGIENWMPDLPPTFSSLRMVPRPTPPLALASPFMEALFSRAPSALSRAICDPQVTVLHTDTGYTLSFQK